MTIGDKRMVLNYYITYGKYSRFNETLRFVWFKTNEEHSTIGSLGELSSLTEHMVHPPKKRLIISWPLLFSYILYHMCIYLTEDTVFYYEDQKSKFFPSVNMIWLTNCIFRPVN